MCGSRPATGRRGGGSPTARATSSRLPVPLRRLPELVAAMSDTSTVWMLGLALVASAAGAWAWRRWHPISFWYAIEFPTRAVLLYLTWGQVASGCGLSRRRRRWRVRFEGIPVVGSAARTASTVLVQEKRRLRRVEVEHSPRLGLIRPTPLGWRLKVRLHDGQHPDDY